jgi:hypothetical protein
LKLLQSFIIGPAYTAIALAFPVLIGSISRNLY